MPDPMKIDHMEEPWIKATIFVPDDVSGRDSEAVRGAPRRADRADLCRQRAMIIYNLPLNEVVFDFYDRLKSVSRGYASFDYHVDGLRGEATW
jgi:GTP-binding protein LepA